VSVHGGATRVRRVLPPGDADNAARWKSIKAAFSKSLLWGERRSARHVEKGERGVWQCRYWEHPIRDERDLAAHMSTSIR
jgi:putative transposase